MMKEIWGLWFDIGQREDGVWELEQVEEGTRKRIRLVGLADLSIVEGKEFVVRLKLLEKAPVVREGVTPEGKKFWNPPFTISSLVSIVRDLIIYKNFFYDDIRGKTFERFAYEDFDGNVLREYKDNTFK